MVGLHASVDPVVNGLHLAAAAAGADQEEVRIADHPAQVDLHDLDRLAIGRVAGDRMNHLFG
jgi:hypothetical protein